MKEESVHYNKKMSLKNKGVPSKDNSVIAYIHNVSPPRKNRRNTMDYCTLTLQTDCDPHTLPALLFSKQKRKILVDHEASHSPVKLQRLTKLADGKKYIINDMTKISDPRPDKYSFQFKELSSASDQLASVGEIKDVYQNGSTVNVKGKILHVGESRLIPSKQLKVCQLVFVTQQGQLNSMFGKILLKKLKKAIVIQLVQSKFVPGQKKRKFRPCFTQSLLKLQ